MVKESVAMPKYLVLWEVDPSRAAVDAKERGALWSGMIDMVKQDIADGTMLDWGCFVGETNGYTISDESEVELGKDLQRFFPFLTFTVKQIASLDQIAEVARSLAET
jgi:hypothetical protein